MQSWLLEEKSEMTGGSETISFTNKYTASASGFVFVFVFTSLRICPAVFPSGWLSACMRSCMHVGGLMGGWVNGCLCMLVYVHVCAYVILCLSL